MDAPACGAVGRSALQLRPADAARLGKRSGTESQCLRPLKWQGEGHIYAEQTRVTTGKSDTDIKTRVQRGQNNRINYLMNQKTGQNKRTKNRWKRQKTHSTALNHLTPTCRGCRSAGTGLNTGAPNKIRSQYTHLQNYTLCIRRQKEKECTVRIPDRQTPQEHSQHEAHRAQPPDPKGPREQAGPWASENSSST